MDKSSDIDNIYSTYARLPLSVAPDQSAKKTIAVSCVLFLFQSPAGGTTVKSKPLCKGSSRSSNHIEQHWNVFLIKL